jgi:hypothetical protein
VKPSEVVVRARSAIGNSVVYSMDQEGKSRPDGDFPWLVDQHGQKFCDCSKFSMWAIGFKGRKVGDLYYDTSRIFQDATSGKGLLFMQVQETDALPGDLVVYGDHGEHQGHVGVVATVGPSGPDTVVHCSLGNYKKWGDAIQETDNGVFAIHNAAVVRLKALKEETTKA